MSDIYRDLMERFIVCSLKDRIDDACTFCCMHLHLCIFLISKLAGLSQDGIIDCDLAQVVHRRSLDNIFAELLSKTVFSEEHEHGLLIAVRIVLYLIYKDPDDVTGTSDVTSRGVVTAFYHGRHAEDQPVMHLNDVLSLLGHFRRQLVVIV